MLLPNEMGNVPLVFRHNNERYHVVDDCETRLCGEVSGKHAKQFSQGNAHDCGSEWRCQVIFGRTFLRLVNL